MMTDLYDERAEQAVIGALVTDPLAVESVRDWLAPSHFFLLKYHAVYQAILALHDRGEAVDLVTLVPEVKRLSNMPDNDIPVMLMQAMRETPTSVNLEVYARLVQRLGVRRDMLRALDESRALVMDESLDTTQIVGDVEARINAAATSTPLEPERTWPNILDGYADYLERLWDGHESVMGFDTGFPALNRMVNGLRPGHVWIVGGVPGMGKTSFGLQLCVAAAKQGAAVGLWTGEMTTHEIIHRMICQQMGVSDEALRTGAADKALYLKTVSLMDGLQYCIDETPAITIETLRNKARRWKRDCRIDVLFVDYLQLFGRSPGIRDERGHATHIANMLKQIARELQVTVIAASQVNRDIYNRSEKKPHNGDLRESSAIEANADVIVFPWRPQLFDDSKPEGEAYLYVTKHRHGKKGRLPLYFHGEATRFLPGIEQHVDLGG